MDSILNEVCILVTAAFALTLVPGLRRPERSLLSGRDQGTALLVFTILALIEEATVSHAGLIHERIVAVCAVGLVAGPWVGLVVSVFVTWLAVAHHGLPLVRLHRNFHVVRWFGRRVALPLAPQAGATSGDGILSDFGGIVAAEWPDLLFGSSFARGTAEDRADRHGPCAARFGHGVDSGYRRAGTRPRRANTGSGFGRGAHPASAHESTFFVQSSRRAITKPRFKR
jgi:hypothetical protein